MCRDCKVLGGRRKPCWPHPFEGNPHGYACPRREWPDRDSAPLADLARLGAHEASAHLFDRGWQLELGDLPIDEQRRLWRRLLRAYGDVAIASVFWPKVEGGE